MLHCLIKWLSCSLAFFAVALIGSPGLFAASQASIANLPRPTPQQAAWEDAELGMFIHWDMEVFDAANAPPNGPKNSPQDFKWRAWIGTISPSKFNPTQINTDQWLAVGQSMGARYAVFTAKHCSGFLMWQSDVYPYGVKQAAWQNGQGDVVEDFVASCKKYSIQPGLYCSAGANSYQQVWRFALNFGKGGGDPAQLQRFLQTDLHMYSDLWTHAGSLNYLWFDGGVGPLGPQLATLISRLQPGAVSYDGPLANTPAGLTRGSGNERGMIGYPCWETASPQHRTGAGDPDGTLWAPAECDVPLRYHVWMWRPDDENKILSLSSLMTMYLDSVGRGCNLIVNANIDPDGLVPQADAQRLAEFGAEIKKWFGTSIAQTTGRGNEVDLQLARPQSVNFVSIMEDITQGQRIRAYAVDGLINGQWKQLCAGESVGHKRIQQFDPVTVSALRLRVTQSVAEPVIREFAVYNIQTLPPDPNNPAITGK